ncbi:MAG TPA: MFS transporter [Stellaceae bacterium]|nr:MFS transporter [Stellaceae bacterium]
MASASGSERIGAIGVGDPAWIAARMQRLPTTRFSWTVVLLVAGALVVEALDIGTLGTILPVLRKALALNPSQIGLLAASSALGIVIGMIPAGRLADRFGRKPLLIAGILWFAAGTAIAAFSPNFTFLLIVRGLSGLGMAAAFIMPYSIISEFVSERSRTAFSGILETALGLGYLLPPILGLIVVPFFPYAVAWRVFFLAASLPILYVWAIWRYLPESPRWLSRVGRVDEAERVLGAIEARIERITGKKLPPPCLEPEVASPVLRTAGPSLRKLRVVWRPPHLPRTIALIFGYFGIASLWYLALNYVPSMFVDRHIALGNAFLFTLVITAAQIPGKLLNGILGEIVGRKAAFAAYTLLAVIGAWGFGHASTPFAMVAFGSLILFASGGSAPCYKMWYAEIYPTPVRATGQATVESIGARLFGGVIWTYLFPVLLSSFGIAATMMIVALMGCFSLAVVVPIVPETRRRTVERLEAAG